MAELDGILAFVSKFSPASAERVESRIRHVVDWIGKHPEAAQQMTGRSDVRRMPLIRYPYAVYYLISPSEVTILSIRHCARRPLEADDL